MIRVTELRLPVDHDALALESALVARLAIRGSELIGFTVFRRSHDARKNSALTFTYTVDAELHDEAGVLARFADNPKIRPTPRMDLGTSGWPRSRIMPRVSCA